MLNKNAVLISILIVFVVVSMLGLSSAARQFEKYGNISVESSIIKALLVENQTEMRVIITLDYPPNKTVEILKEQIISDLSEDEFELIRNLKESEWFSGYLTLQGLIKLKDNPQTISITESKGGISLNEEQNQNPLCFVYLYVDYWCCVCCTGNS